MRPELNIELLRNLVLWARGESDKLDEEFQKLGIYSWKQDVWATQKRNGVCETSFCIAGAAVAFTEETTDRLTWYDMWEDEDGFTYSDIAAVPPGTTVRRNAAYIYGPDGHNVLIRDRAVQVLGIDGLEASSLFYPSNDIEDIERIATEIAENHGKVLFP